MTIWTDIEIAQQKMPKGIATIEEILEAAELGIALFPIISAEGPAAKREFFVRLIAIIVRAIKLMDDEIDVEADDEIPF